MKLQQASKEYRCDDCGYTIPKGHMYWRREETVEGVVSNVTREHTNCLNYTKPEAVR